MCCCCKKKAYSINQAELLFTFYSSLFYFFILHIIYSVTISVSDESPHSILLPAWSHPDWQVIHVRACNISGIVDSKRVKKRDLWQRRRLTSARTFQSHVDDDRQRSHDAEVFLSDAFVSCVTLRRLSNDTRRLNIGRQSADVSRLLYSIINQSVNQI